MFRRVGHGATPDAGSGTTANTGNMTRPILRDRIAGRPDYRRPVLLVVLFGADDTDARVIAAPLSTFAVATPIAGKIGDL